MALLLPLVFGFFFMITAWTYCLRNWLAAIMVNKRRRRAIIVGVTMGLVLLSQLPNLLTNVWFRSSRPNLPQHASPAQIQEWARHGAGEASQTDALLNAAHRYVPFLWLPQGAKKLAEGNPWPAVWGALGMLAIGALGLRRAYRGTLRLYQGGENNKPAAAPSTMRPTAARRKLLVEQVLPAIPEEAAAVALASFRSMTRAPEVKMALAMNALFFVVIGASVLVHRPAELPAGFRPFVASATVAVAFLGLMQVTFNHFGFDRSGFRAIVLLPTPRSRVLLGKNLALLPVAFVVFAVYLGLATIMAHLRATDILTAGFEFAGAFLMMSVMGNLASILVPYRIAAGSLKPTKTKGTTVLLLIVVNMLSTLALLPVFLPAGLSLLGDWFGWLPGAAVALVGAILLAAVSTWFYWRALEPLGRLLQRREQRILQVVTQEVE
jgi:hypothetical protein